MEHALLHVSNSETGELLVHCDASTCMPDGQSQQLVEVKCLEQVGASATTDHYDALLRFLTVAQERAFEAFRPYVQGQEKDLPRVNAVTLCATEESSLRVNSSAWSECGEVVLPSDPAAIGMDDDDNDDDGVEDKAGEGDEEDEEEYALPPRLVKCTAAKETPHEAQRQADAAPPHKTRRVASADDEGL